MLTWRNAVQVRACYSMYTNPIRHRLHADAYEGLHGFHLLIDAVSISIGKSVALAPFNSHF